ncbi:MAG: carboxypeptidase regulatory-like domain-containing protein [Planctomycetes bacterium]|nr:carboxypeptidase regulatory-like domain-containing protein [Planctomycetota bacterium]
MAAGTARRVAIVGVAVAAAAAAATARVTWNVPTWGELVLRFDRVPAPAELESVLVRNRSFPVPAGTRELSWRLAPGEARLEAVFTAGSPWSWPPSRVEVPASGRVEVLVEPTSGPREVAGFVVDTSGVPVEGVRVSIRVMESDLRTMAVSKSASTDVSGSFVFRGLPEGETSMMVDGESAKGRHLGPRVHVADEDVARALAGEPLRLVVVPGIRLSVCLPPTWRALVTDADRVALDVIPVEPPGLCPGQDLHARVADDGSFVLEHRLPGRYLARLLQRRDVLAEQAFVVADDYEEGTTVEVVLEDVVSTDAGAR